MTQYKDGSRNGIPVNDLFPFTKENVSLIGPDHIHLTEEGYQLVGAQVAREIEKWL